MYFQVSSTVYEKKYGVDVQFRKQVLSVFFFRQKFGFPREKGVSLSNFVTYLRALMLQFILNSLLLIYSFVFSLWFFPYVIFIFYFQEYRKIRKTQGDQKDLSRERMKTKLRIKLI